MRRMLCLALLCGAILGCGAALADDAAIVPAVSEAATALPESMPTPSAEATALPTATPEPPPELLYALPCADTVYKGRTWFMDCAITGACTVSLEVYADAERTSLAASVRKKLANGGQFRVAWNGKRNGRAVAPGTYYCKAFASGREEEAFLFSLTVSADRAPELAVAPTGPLLPESMDDAAVWAAMTAPLTVTTVKATAHQNLYAKPNGKSEVVGTVHGQSQGLEVVEIEGRYALVRAWRHEDAHPVEGYVPLKKLKVVESNPRYGVLIDKSEQLLTVYEQGKPIGQMRVSTGLATEEKPFRETRAGAFMIIDRVSPFMSNGFRCEYALRFDGGNLLHQVGYDADRGGFAEQTAQLGERASEGCVRMDHRTDAEHPINAYWMWTHLPYGTKVLVLE